MKNFGFDNFRKFQHFEPIEFAPITLLVGQNNAGKSTLVKGILAMADFLKSSGKFVDEDTTNKESIENRIKSLLAHQPFYFNTNYSSHIGTFERALYNSAQESVITFFATFDGEDDITVRIEGDPRKQDLVSGTISTISLRWNIGAKNPFIVLDFDLQHNEGTLSFLPIDIQNAEPELLPALKKYRALFSKTDPVAMTIKIPLAAFYKNLKSIIKVDTPDFVMSLVRAVENAINLTLSEEGKKKENKKNDSPSQEEPTKKRQAVLEWDEDTTLFFKKLRQIDLFCAIPSKHFKLPRFVHSLNIEYLYAHAVTQAVLYSAKDTNDFLSQTICSVFTKVLSDKAKKFIKKWMKEFEIGSDYKITSIGGEAYMAKITNLDGSKVNLADKGMGSIQLMTLLFRLGLAIDERPERLFFFDSAPTFLIEEPEQNLHPSLQSELAVLFNELHRDYGFRFLVETHSEYLIRRTQVIVGNEEYLAEKDRQKVPQSERFAKNPFKVYYFTGDEACPYYDMEYTPSGLFKRKFGEGFMDEAGKLELKLWK